MNNLFHDIDYKSQYSLYRKLPIVAAGISSGMVALGTIIAFFTLLKTAALTAFIVLIIGALITVLTGVIWVFLLTLVISPVIVQTDTLLEISAKLNGTGTTTQTTRTTTTKTVAKWRCPTCGTTNDLSETTCAHCFHKKPEVKSSTPTATKWCCPSCGDTNEMNVTVCPTCSYKKP